ncbi:hypothetical protein [Dyella sp. A6]|uniref:hypothetical protein n=1 Tax=Dyella aluminiiresistens TaxID=3069105 RepID=UPI002E77D191|nr:hypothetical protein [Dyella sp. A6]
MIRKFAIAILLVVGVALSGSVLAQTTEQPTPKAMAAPHATTAEHHHAKKHHKHHHKHHHHHHHKAHAKKAAKPMTDGNTGK